MCKWSFLGKKDKYLQWKVQEFITRCSLQLSAQNDLYFSTRCSVQSQAVPGHCLCSFQVLKPFQKFAKQARKQQQLPQGLSEPRECHRERALAPGVCAAFRSGQSSPAEHSTLKALLPTEPKYSIMELHLQMNPRAFPSLAVMNSRST